ncbi:MAG: iron-containing alcohol dehydrogenase [Acidobacteriota bacterium]
MRFEFATANRIIFGDGCLRQVGDLTVELGRRALVVTGNSVSRAVPLLEILSVYQVGYVVFPVAGEPTVDVVREAADIARERTCDLVIGFGGGSALDAGKAASALLTNPGDLMDYLEVIGRGQALPQPAAPYVAIPTTAGTGTEVTRNAVLASPDHGVKVSLRSRLMVPRVALVDPVLTHSMPPEITASTGMDALTQLIEPYVSAKATPITDALCVEGIRLAARSLRRACEHGDDAIARSDMARASLFGGMALANASLGAVHGFAAAIGGATAGPHGAVCARLLPGVVEANWRALTERARGSDALRRYREVARILTGDSMSTAQDGVEWLYRLCEDLKIPRLRAYGLTLQDLAGIVDKSAKASSMKGNPIQLTTSEMMAIVERAL